MHAVQGDLLLCLYDDLQSVPHMSLTQRRKSEACASRLQSWDDFADVVAYQAETRIPDILFDNCGKT